MCKYGKIYKVKMVKDGPGDYDYHWDILSSRPDERPEEKFQILLYIVMKVVKDPEISQIDIDLIKDDIEGLAKDIITLDADVE